jgi:hypothetical protein
MKSSGDLAKRMKSRESENFHRETLRLPIRQARKHVKQLFSEFPSATFMTGGKRDTRAFQVSFVPAGWTSHPHPNESSPGWFRSPRD